MEIYTAEEITTIDKDYKHAKKVFQKHPASVAKERLNVMIALRAIKHTSEYDGHYELDGEDIVLQIEDSDHDHDHGTYRLPLNIFMSLTAKEIKQHDSELQNKASEITKEKNNLHSGDYIRTRNAISSAVNANIKIEIPQWYKDEQAVIQSKTKEAEELIKKKYVEFSWQ